MSNKRNTQRLTFSNMKPAVLRFNFEKYKGNGVSLYRLANNDIALDITQRRKRSYAEQARIRKRSQRNSRK